MMAGETLKINIFSDSSTVRAIACRRGLGRVRRLGQPFVQQLTNSGRVEILRFSTDDNPADLGTKVLPMTTVHWHMRRMGCEVPGEVGYQQVSAVTLDPYGQDSSAEGHSGREDGGLLSQLRSGGQRAARALVGGLVRGLKPLAELRAMRRDD